MKSYGVSFAQIEQLRMNANGIEAIEALLAQLRGFTALRS